ncbi:hypothetical protein CAPTEDRAFT_93552 [Capitella teleta]|uniref:Guanylate cyclase n=1 Tax=Capitella teleta TaxID=283909 RepID=R7UDB0_CAPTE|nr:hypothetical protein CAPTEDRAFT_93552 [Capitella teleta]|eukprot:ELU04091.1 hypothetical protein CAPTEDRAFT_93552 [Capitella teleta]
MRELNHENLNPFVGACNDYPNVCIITVYCDKGTLQDILENDDIKLDWMFKSSLIQDAINGMVYIHHSKLHCHGNLRSSTCVVDGRWVLKIAAFGLKTFKEDPINETEYKTLYNRLWTAPELLRKGPIAMLYGSQKGDVYSFGIILQELLTREPPYNVGDLSPKEILFRVKEGGPNLYRPNVKIIDNDVLQKMMQQSWAEEAENRPSFISLRTLFRSINRGRKTNIMDTMISKLEKYANNLEEIVSKRTAELVEEKKKTDTLLYRMLPKSVALRLKNGEQLEAELYDSVTIYFSDIVGFTSLSSESTPFQVVHLLNDLYTLFDGIIDTRDVYKVETIGDAYMVCSGVPQRNGKRHVAEIALMALELLRVIQEFKIQHRPGVRLKLRIGLHTGACAAGVVGQTMPRYCLFGDTVNMASRMESNGEALKIHMSEESNEALKEFPHFITAERGLIPIKGKGEVMTYWLMGCKDQEEHNISGPHEPIGTNH